MAKLSIDTLSYIYDSGFRNIRRAYHASIDVLDREHDEAQRRHDAYENADDNDDQYDDEGFLISSTHVELQNEMNSAAMALRVVREAFVTSAFHFWEAWARMWTGSHNTNFYQLRDKLSNAFAPHPELRAVNHLNNFIKHRKPDHALKLAALRPDWFAHPPASIVETRRAIYPVSVNEAVVEEVFQIIEASGPKHFRHDKV